MPFNAERFIAALIAAHEIKLDFNRIAEMYGDGTTVNSVEHRLRPYRRMAEEMRRRAAHDDTSTGGQSQPRASCTPRNPPTPRTPRVSRASGTSRSGSTRTSRKGSTKKPVKPTNEPCDPIVIEGSGDEAAIKEEIKRENEKTRELLGINREALDDFTEDEGEEKYVPTKRPKTESSINEHLLGISPGRKPFVDSKSNGYVLPVPETPTVKPEHGNVAKRLDELLAGSGKFECFHFLDEA